MELSILSPDYQTQVCIMHYVCYVQTSSLHGSQESLHNKDELTARPELRHLSDDQVASASSELCCWFFFYTVDYVMALVSSPFYCLVCGVRTFKLSIASNSLILQLCSG